jgi:hypothetical protein
MRVTKGTDARFTVAGTRLRTARVAGRGTTSEDVVDQLHDVEYVPIGIAVQITAVNDLACRVSQWLGSIREDTVDCE